jgi:hypothetical protein
VEIEVLEIPQREGAKWRGLERKMMHSKYAKDRWGGECPDSERDTENTERRYFNREGSESFEGESEEIVCIAGDTDWGREAEKVWAR